MNEGLLNPLESEDLDYGGPCVTQLEPVGHPSGSGHSGYFLNVVERRRRQSVQCIVAIRSVKLLSYSNEADNNSSR